MYLFSFLKEYSHGQQQKTQEGELKISAVFSVSGSPLGKKKNWINESCLFILTSMSEKEISICISKVDSSLCPFRMAVIVYCIISVECQD